MKNLSNILFLLGITLFSSIYYLQVMNQSNNFEHHAIITFTVIALGAFILIQFIFDIRKINKEEIKKYFQSKWVGKVLKSPTLTLILILTTYLFLISWLGYFVSSFIFFVVVVYWLGSKNWKQIILVPVIILVCIYLLFETFLQQNIISGLLI